MSTNIDTHGTSLNVTLERGHTLTVDTTVLPFALAGTKTPISIFSSDGDDNEAVNVPLTLTEAEAVRNHLTVLIDSVKAAQDEVKYALPTAPGTYQSGVCAYVLGESGVWFFGAESRSPALMKRKLGRHVLTLMTPEGE